MPLLRKVLTSPIYLVTLLEAALAVACYIAAAYIAFPMDASIYLEYEGGIQDIATMGFVFLLVGYLFDFYKVVRVRSKIVLLFQLFHLVGIIFLIYAGLAFLNPALVAPSGMMMLGNGLLLIVLSLWRLFVRPALWTAISRHTVVFVGGGKAVERLASAYHEDPSLAVRVLGFVIDDADQESPGSPVLGSQKDLMSVIAKVKPARIIVGAEHVADKRTLKTLFDLRSTGLAVESAADVYETLFGRIYLPAIDPYTVIFRNDLSAPPGSVALQSIYTNLLALVAAAIGFPVILAIATILKVTGHRNVFLKQACVGLFGIPFIQYRFDTSGSGLFARFLRRYRLEAIPQILNIVRGDMTLIGPRAERVEFDRVLDELIPFWRQKQSVKPGVLGWGQLHCDTQPSEDTLERLEYDLYYIKHISVILDAYIILRGIKRMMADRPADFQTASTRTAAA